MESNSNALSVVSSIGSVRSGNESVDHHHEEEVPDVPMVDSSAPEENETLLVENDLPAGSNSFAAMQRDKTLSYAKEKKRKGWRRYLGVMYAIIASVLYALVSLIVKILTSKDMECKKNVTCKSNSTCKEKCKFKYHYSPLTVGVWRFQGIFWPSLATLLYCRFILKKDVLKAFKRADGPGKWKLAVFLTGRAVVGIAATILVFYSLFYLKHLADSTVISNSTPVFVTFVAWLVLGEPCGIIPVVCAFLTLCGVAVISRPPIFTGQSFDEDTLKGVCFAFASMLFATMTYILLRKIRKIHYALITTFFGLLGSIVCFILTTITDKFEFPRHRDHWLLAAALALLTFAAQYCLTFALKFETASLVALCRTCDVVFAAIWQAMLLSLFPDMWSYTGAAIVVVGVVISGLRKWIGDLPEDNATRIKFSFLLS